MGKCNSDELYKIIESIKPDVIFLEALKENYSDYDRIVFSQFGVYNERLELKAIQIYSQNHTFEYVPVLEIGLSDEFKTKIQIVSESRDCQRLLDQYNLLVRDGGFQFLNSKTNIVLHKEMRELENRIIGNETLQQKVNANINAYENSMLRTIYSFCKEKSFDTAIFMCGAAHRKSIIEKIREYEIKEGKSLGWILYNDTF